MRDVNGLVLRYEGMQVPLVDLPRGDWQPQGKDPGNGMNKYNNRAYGDTDPKEEYGGAVQNSRPNGWGIWSTEGPPRQEYIGTWKNGQPNGHGMFRLNGTTIYEGGFLNGKPHGEGRYLGTGETYSGRLRAGRFYGQVACQKGNTVRMVDLGGG